MEDKRRRIVSTLINSIPVNRLRTICEDFALDADPSEGVDELRRRVRTHVVNLHDELNILTTPPAPEDPTPPEVTAAGKKVPKRKPKPTPEPCPLRITKKGKGIVKDTTVLDPAADGSGIQPFRKVSLRRR